jgi:hypothetical protein
MTDGLGKTRNETTPRAKSRPRERVGATRVRHGRAHLTDREDHGEEHDSDQQCGDQQTAPTGGAESNVPASEVTRDNGGDADSPETPETCCALEAALLEISGLGRFVRGPRGLRYISHSFLPERLPGTQAAASALGTSLPFIGTWCLPLERNLCLIEQASCSVACVV